MYTGIIYKDICEPARADRVAIKLRKVNYIMSCFYFTICLLLSLMENEKEEEGSEYENCPEFGVLGGVIFKLDIL
jgi:hypothetical protein